MACQRRPRPAWAVVFDILVLVLPLFCLSATVTAQEVHLQANALTARMPDDASPRTIDPTAPLGRFATLFNESPGHPLAFAQARALLGQGAFKASAAAVPNLGNHAPPLWMHLVLENDQLATQPYRLFVAEGWTDRVDGWLVTPDGRTTHWRAGDARSPARYLRPGLGFAFDAQLPPGRNELFVRADSIDSAALALRAIPLGRADALEGPAQHWLGLVHGFLVALVVVYGLLWLALRERSLFRYVIYVGSYLYMHFAYSGIAAQVAWPESPPIARFAILAGMTLFSSAGLWFARDFLHLQQWAPRTDKALAWLVRVAMVAMAACIVLDQPSAAVAMAFPYIMLFTVLMVVLGVAGVRHRCEQGRIFLVASLVSMVGAFVTTLAVMGKLPFSNLTFRAVEVGVMMEASIWALALGLRLRRDREDRVHALQLAEHDPLTALCNRRGFMERAKPVRAAAQSEQRPLSVVLLDIDHFKSINDRHGHDAGDRTLVAVASRLRTLSRPGDVLARWGGEEFVVLLPDTPHAAALVFAERLRASLADMAVAVADGSIVHITASLGVAESAPGIDLEGILREADAALYFAKQAGRNRVGPATATMPITPTTP